MPSSLDVFQLVRLNKQGQDYYSGDFPVPIGNILVETNNVLDVVRYFVLGIKSRNTITISQTEYYELSLSNMVLIIFSEALAKFNVSRNTLMILPFEECFPKDYDEVIEIEDGNIQVKPKEFKDRKIIYVENHDLDPEVDEERQRLRERNIKFELIYGSLEMALKFIQKAKPEVCSIYTKNPDIAYEFVTLASSPNVFVNTSVLHAEELNDKKNTFYYKKKIIYPSGQNINLEEYYKEYNPDYKEQKVEVTEKEELEESVSDTNKKIEETALTEVVNPWYKRIFEKIKNLFFKK